MKKMFGMGIIFAGILFPFNCLKAGSVKLQVDGILGQSQSNGTEPLEFVDANGIVLDQQGNLWTASGQKLFVFTRQADGRWHGSPAAKLPYPVPVRGLRWDGERIYMICYDWNVYSFDPQTSSLTKFCALDNIENKDRLQFAVSPSGTTGGVAAKAKFFALDGKKVYGYSSDGTALGVVLTPEPPKDETSWCRTIGIEPGSGDLLIGTYYPDNKIYRYDSKGTQVTLDGWPRPGFSHQMVALKDKAWMLTESGSAQSLSPASAQASDEMTIEPYWTIYADGLVRDKDGSYWISCSQGLVQFDRNGQPTKHRLGGLTGVQSMAVGKEGVLIAAIAKGQNMVRLAIDDEPDTAFTSNANEPFRAGGGWSSRVCGLVWDGQRFLALDEVGKQLWNFDPWHTAWKEKPWMPLTKSSQFTNPMLMALGGDRLWVWDDQKLLEGKISSLESWRPITLPGMTGPADVTALAASADGGLLVVATSHSVTGFRRAGDGSYAAAWNRANIGEEISAVAVAGNHVIAADKAKGTLTALSLDKGEAETSVGTGQIKGGFQPVCLTAYEHWLFVADEEGKRILRFKVVE